MRILFFTIVMLILVRTGSGQSHNYWTRSFNEESSLLSGAVVGGGAGPSAIYYNPSSISDITESKFSLHASLFAFEFVKIKNALGDGIDVNSSSLSILPRFLSVMIKPKKLPNWSFELAFLNNEDYNFDFTNSVDYSINILTHLPGDERYFALVQYFNKYRDDWLGFGGSWNINKQLYLGMSMFVSVRALENSLSVDIEAFPITDSINEGNDHLDFYSANYMFNEYVKFNNYRLLWKFGAMYKTGQMSIGLTLTSPSLGVFSDGKKIYRKLKQSNISNPETGEPVPDYVITDYQQRKAVKVNFKSPFSVAAGLTYTFSNNKKILYSTVEYFDGLPGYKLLEANENEQLNSGVIFDHIESNEWLTVLTGADPVFNVAVGYQSELKEDLLLRAGFRTDFNYKRELDNRFVIPSKEIKSFAVNLYHLTGGVTARILGQDLITGLQYTFGYERNQQQLINLSDPVEYNKKVNAALQGDKKNIMNTLMNSISLYFGATFNFGGN